MQTIWYSSSDCEDPPRYPLTISARYDVMRPIEQEELAQLCAADYGSKFGWTQGAPLTWPRDITLYLAQDSQPIASFTVECELTPTYYSRRKRIAA